MKHPKKLQCHWCHKSEDTINKKQLHVDTHTNERMFSPVIKTEIKRHLIDFNHKKEFSLTFSMRTDGSKAIFLKIR